MQKYHAEDHQDEIDRLFPHRVTLRFMKRISSLDADAEPAQWCVDTLGPCHAHLMQHYPQSGPGVWHRHSALEFWFAWENDAFEFKMRYA